MASPLQTFGTRVSHPGLPMGDFYPLSTEKGEHSTSRGNFDEDEEMTFFKLESLPVRSSSWSSLSKQYFQKRYLCLWVLAALFPFIVLRMMVIYTPFQLPASSPISLLSGDLEGLTPISGSPPATQRDVQSGSLVRPDEDAWISHDDWINRNRSPRVSRRKNHGPPHPLKRIPGDKDQTLKGSHSSLPPVESFGLPEDNEKEQPAAWVRAEEEKEKLASQATEKQGDVGTKDAVEEEAVSKSKSGEEKKDGDNRNEEEERKADEQREAEDNSKLDVQKSEAGQKDAEEKTQPDEKENQPEEKEKDGERQYEDANPLQNVTVRNDHTEATSAGECDLFDGDWVHNSEGPLYTNATCPYIQGHQNCMKNGRPDTNYLYWNWKPRECDLPRFDAKSFLDSFTGKTIGFVGDSLARNQMQSLLCMLWQVEVPTETYQAPNDQDVRWFFEQHRVTLAVLWSPYLLKEEHEGVMGFEKGQSVLYLDVLDTAWTSMMSDFDIIVLSIGQWYLKGSVYVKEEKVVGCHYCPTLNFTELGFYDAYRDGIRLVLDKVAAEFTGIAVMSTFAISHFEGGSWSDGGQCKREWPLSKEEGEQFPGPHNDMHDIVINEFNTVTSNKSKLKEDVHLEFLDVTKVSMQRADGHPGPYREQNPFQGKNSTDWVQNDCLHWCLPGPADTWNQLLVKLAQKYL